MLSEEQAMQLAIEQAQKGLAEPRLPGKIER